MKKRTFLRYISIVAILMFTFAFTAHADFGDYGGDADYGYDYNDYGGDYDSYDYDDDAGYNGGGVVYYSSSDSDDYSSTDGSDILIIVVIVVIVFGIPIIKALLSKNKKKVVAPGALPTDVSTLKPVDAYNSLDPAFSQADFKEEISNMYIRFQNAWQNKKLEEIRPDLSDDFYAQLDRQLDNYRKNRQTNRIERISVLGVELLGWKQENGNDIMVAKLQTRIVDYVVDDATGNVIRGSNTAEKFMTYEWSLIRTSGRQTGSATANATNCPNCGAPLNLNKSAKCEYCGSIIETDDFDWVLSGIKGLSQRTA